MSIKVTLISAIDSYTYMYTMHIFYLISSSYSIHRQRRSHKRVVVAGKENSGIIKSKENERIEQVTPSHSLSHSHNIVGLTTEPPRPPALERMFSTESTYSTTTTSSQISTNLSINQEGRNERHECTLHTG